jgi:hypothetical protein
MESLAIFKYIQTILLDLDPPLDKHKHYIDSNLFFPFQPIIIKEHIPLMYESGINLNYIINDLLFLKDLTVFNSLFIWSSFYKLDFYINLLYIY